MRKLFLYVLASMASLASFTQTINSDSAVNALKIQKDNALRAAIHADSVKIEKEFTEKIKWEKLKPSIIYPVLKGGEFSGVVPVSNPTEVPDPSMEYKLLIELTAPNPDTALKEINYGLSEVARMINLHVASGIPLKKITTVVIIHAEALNAITTNEYYKEHFGCDNPNIKLLDDMRALGVSFIACGQAMAFLDIKKEALLPFVKISLTAQTVLSSYQLKGFVWFRK